MNTFLPTRRSSSSSTKKITSSFLRFTFGSVFALLLLMSGGVFGQINIPLHNTDYNTNFNGWNGTTPSGFTNSGGSYQGTSATGGTGGLYAVTSLGYGYQGSGSLTSTTLTGSYKNTTGNTITSLTISYDAFRINHQASRIPTWTVSSTGLGSPDLSTLTYTYVNNSTVQNNTITLTGLSVANNATFEIIFTGERGNGSGSVPKIGLNNVKIKSNFVVGKTVTFNANTGTGTMSNQTASVATNLTSNGFTKANNVFANWATAADGTGTTYADGASYPFTADATLYAQWTPVTTTLADNGSAIGAGNITQGTNNNIIASFTLAQTGANGTLNAVTVPTTGTYVAADVNGSGFKLWYNTTNTFGTATELKAVASAAAGSGETLSFSSLTQTLTSGATIYFWVTSNIIVTATPGNTLTAGALGTSNITMASGTKSGSSSASGTKTIIATAVPTISVTPGTLADFGDVCINTDSALKSYDVVGVNLSGNVTVTAPSGFKVRKGVDAYATTATLVPDGSGDVNTTIDVIYSPTVAGVTGTLSITNASTGATTKNVSVSGTGINGAVTINSVTATAITTTTATSGGTAVSTSCGTITAKGVVWGTSLSPTIPSANSTDNGTGTGDYSSSISGLTENTLYYVRSYVVNSNGITVHGANTNFTTVSKAPTAASASTATTTGFTASWTAPATQGSEALTYTVKVYSNNTFTTQVGSDITAISGTSTIVTGLSTSTTYYYTVAAVNAGGTSAVAGYTTGITTLAAPSICGSESFGNSNATASYANNSFTGDNGVTWTYVASRDEETTPITGKGLMLRRVADNSKVTSSAVSGGIADFTCKFLKGFTSSNNRQIQLFVNGVAQTPSLAFNDTDVHTYTVTGINISGDVIIEIINLTAYQVVIDDISWTCFADCVAPTVALSGTPVTSIATTTVTLNGNVTAAGGFAINTRGFEYSTNSAMTGSATKSTAATATGTYSENLTSLVANTVYYYRGYAVNDCTPNKTGYTATSSYPTFTTLHNAPTVGTGSAAAATSFTANWTAPTGGAAAYTYQIEVDNDSGFGTVDFTASGITGLSVSATGLLSSTTYYYRVRAVNAGGNSAWSSVSAGIATLAPAPEINIKQGVTIIESAGTFAHGNQITTTSGSAVTFTIENTGEAALSVGALSKSGTDAGQFTITQPLSSSVAAGGTTTFTVVFSPTSLGAKTAQLSLVNGDADENPYIINLTGTGTASQVSDIVTDGTFVYNTNIDYKNYITADITAVNSVELGRFTIRDGGATTDADNLGTILNTLSFTVGYSANLQKLAIYDGATEVAEVAAAGTTNFTGLTLTAADNGIKTFTIRGSFKTAVTDNQRIQLTVASATASATGSGFGTISATTSTTGTDNVIVVTASKLLFSTITNGVVNADLASFTISATDSNNNIDKDISGAVALTPITGMTSGSPYTLTSGTVTVASGVQFNAAQADITLNASTTSPVLSGTSNVFSVILVTFPTNSYHTATAGEWNSSGTGTATWTQWDGSNFNTVADPSPTGDKNVYIHHNITIPDSNGSTGNYTITVMDNATLTFSGSNAWTAKGMKVEGGSTLQLNTTSLGIASGTSLELADNGTMIINAVANNNSAIWNGTEVFHPSSNVVIKEWGVNSGTTSYRPLLNNVKINATTYNGYSAVFGNLKIDLASSGEASGSFILLEGNITLNVAHGNLELINPHPINNINIKTTGGLTTSGIGGNFIVDDGYAPTKKVIFSTSGALSFTINGNMQLDGSTTNITTATSATALDIIVNGNLNITSGAVLDFVGSSTASPLINFDLKRNLNGIGSGLLRGNSSGANYNFNFSGTSPQTVDIESTSSTENSTLNFNIKTGSTLKLLNRNFELGQNSKLNVEIGGTIDFDYASGTPLAVTASGSQTGSVFDAKVGGKLLINSPVGISSTGTATGNVQTATRTYGAAKYHYVGTADQITGTGQPAIVGDLVSDNSNLVTLSNAVTVNGTLEVIKGILDLNSKVTQGSSSTVKIDNAATLRITGTSTFPTGFTTHTFDTNSIVHYAGSNQAIAAIPSPANKYGKLKVSGTGTKTLATTDVQVGNTLEVTSSLLSIEQDKTLTVTNGVTTSNDAISVANGGSLVQVTDVNNASANNNTGKIAVARITQPMYKFDYTYWSAPVGGTTLHDLSPDTPANRYFYWNPVVVSPAANWTVISGGTGTMSAGKGYIIRAPSSYGADPTLLASYTAYSGSFSGVPNNGTVSVDVSGSDTVDVWNLVGNPYPSAIDASAFLDANVGGSNDILGGTLYFWTHNTPYGATTTYAYSTADYATWNGTGETATTSDTVLNNSNSPSGKIAAAQAFFVRGTANGTAVFKNTMREKGNNMQFFRGAATAETTTTVEKNRVWLNLKGANNAFSQTLVGYVTNATNDYDVRYDGESFGGNFVTFYSVNNGKNLVSQGRALPFVTTDEVPLGYKATGTGNLTIAIDHTDGALATQAIYLKDNVLNVVHDLTAGAYTFAAVAGTFNDRFVLRYLPAVDLANPTFEEQLSHVTIRKNDATLRINSPYETIDAVMVYDIMGRLVFEKKDCNTNTFEASHIVYSEQTLIVKVRLSNGGVVTKKVL